MRFNNPLDRNDVYLIKVPNVIFNTYGNSITTYGYTYKFMTDLHLFQGKLKGTIIKKYNDTTLGVLYKVDENTHHYDRHDTEKITPTILKMKSYSANSRSVISYSNKPLMVKVDTYQLDFVQDLLIEKLKQNYNDLDFIHQLDYTDEDIKMLNYIIDNMKQYNQINNRVKVEIAMNHFIEDYNKIVNQLDGLITPIDKSKKFNDVSYDDYSYILHYENTNIKIPKSITTENNNQIVFDILNESIDTWYDKNVTSYLKEKKLKKVIEKYEKDFNTYKHSSYNNIISTIRNTKYTNKTKLKDNIELGIKLITFNEDLIKNGFKETGTISTEKFSCLTKKQIKNIEDTINIRLEEIKQIKNETEDKLKDLNDIINLG